MPKSTSPEKLVSTEQSKPVVTPFEKSSVPEELSTEEDSMMTKKVVQQQETPIEPPVVAPVEKTTPKKAVAKKRRPRDTASCTRKIKGVLHRSKQQVLSCYDQEALKHPSLKGDFTVQIDIRQGYNKIRVSKDTLKNRNFRSCVTTKMKKWDFGKNCSGISFKKSYVLAAG